MLTSRPSKTGAIAFNVIDPNGLIVAHYERDGEVRTTDASQDAPSKREIARRFKERGKGENLRILLHSLAFGSLKPFIADTVDGELKALLRAANTDSSAVTAESLGTQLPARRGRPVRRRRA